MSPGASPLAAPRPQPARGAVPRHVAIIMDGNGRWATRRHLPRVAGHARGVDVVRGIVQACAERGIEYLTIFAFSSENWRRPPDEVSVLMRLFVTALQREMAKLHEAGVRLHVVGHLESFDPALRRLIAEAEQSTAANTRLHLSVCASYGGRWDIVQAVNALLAERRARGEDPAAPVTEAELEQRLVLSYAPPPDLLIRTGAERRISNFLLWQCAYAELYFTDQLWPEFDVVSLDAALDWYAQRERRFGRTTAQVAGGDRPAARESA